MFPRWWWSSTTLVNQIVSSNNFNHPAQWDQMAGVQVFLTCFGHVQATKNKRIKILCKAKHVQTPSRRASSNTTIHTVAPLSIKKKGHSIGSYKHFIGNIPRWIPLLMDMSTLLFWTQEKGNVLGPAICSSGSCSRLPLSAVRKKSKWAVW